MLGVKIFAKDVNEIHKEQKIFMISKNVYG